MTRILLRLGRACAGRPRRTVLSWVFVLMAVTGLSAVAGGSLTDTMTAPGSSSERAAAHLSEHFPEMSGAEAHLVGRWDTVPGDAGAAIEATRDAVRRVPGVSRVTERVGDGGRAVLVEVRFSAPLAGLDAAAITDALDAGGGALRTSGAVVAVGGEIPESVQGPSGGAEAIGVGMALIVLVLAFGSALAAGLPLVVAGMGLGVGLGLISILALVTQVSTVSPTLGSMLGLGVGIDYALFVVARFRRALADGLTPVPAAALATATAGRSVVFAGISVLIGLAGLAFCGIPGFATMGLAAGLVVLVCVLITITLVPALLAVMGHRVFSRRSRRSGGVPADSFHSARARRWATVVVRRPWPWLIGGILTLLLLAAPALSLRLGQNDAGAESPANPTRIAYDLVAAGFGAGTNGPLVVVADARRTDPGVLRAALSTTAGVVDVSPVTMSPNGTAAVLTVIPDSGPQTVETAQLADRIRSLLPAGADLTGATAAVLDMTDVLSQRIGWVIAAVLLATFVLLMLVFRSVVLPLKAVIGNLLSVGAAFGVMTLAFQTDSGAALLGLPGPVPIAAWAPVVLFAILFGLSMDYEVFMLSAIRERHEAGDDDRTAVVAGVAGTARIITSAAAIMVAVAAGFAFDPGVMVKMIGVGMAAAIVVDVTIVRMILVPAAMAVLGRANWWWPGRSTHPPVADRAHPIPVAP